MKEFNQKSVNKGFFITLEGIEGVGKTTQLSFIEDLIKKLNRSVRVTREPGGTPTGEQIREILLHSKDLLISDTTELCLMFAARAQHLDEIIIPALERGDTVLCDRFTDATYAYQGYGREINLNTINVLENLVQSELRPDLTLLLDVDVEVGLSRAKKRSEADRFERETIEFFERVRQGYLQRAEQEPHRIAIIDASKPIDAVQHQISEILIDRLQT